MRDRLLGNIDYVTALAKLRNCEINYDPSEVRPPDWNFDVHRSLVGRERPGPPEPGGVWETARELVRDYEFTPPELVRVVYHRHDPLLGRTLLLEGHFAALRFYMGGGKVTYEVIKRLDSGQVGFLASCQSQRSPTLGLILRLGWLLFGRRAQLRFYRRCGQRLHDLVQASLIGVPTPAATRPPLEINDLVLVPSGAEPHPLDRLTIRQHNPAR